ncbi:mitochondrial carrier [Didymella exigua CBS 183.55]|uniref:Mitochondrial carrier n=1 Tax=Didymella exigua CBS 183.55 TaxID=1150837 RepID=A0A6A5RJV3_9PLEO|nr:mitochondrial carrier [Didymella exigua CBS 183.55]KAF1926696.1 mitochondrial carrier [Didymella exigua CBS 183.55]
MATIQIPKAAIKSESKSKTSTTVLLSSSAIAGGVEATATYPFEYAKTRVQLQTVPSSHHNPFSVIYNVARYEGIGTLYTGCSTLVLGTAFKVSVRFASFSYFRRHLADEHGALTPARGVLAGSLAGLTESVIAVTPTERLKTLLISNATNQIKAYRGELHAYEDIIRTQSIRGLYRGLVPTILKQSSTQGVKMGSYNIIREFSRRHDVPQNEMTALVTGALAGTVTVYVTQPFDTIKTWTQSARGEGTVNAFRTVVRQSGCTGLWSGSTSRVGRLAFSSSILYTVYEKVATAMDEEST